MGTLANFAGYYSLRQNKKKFNEVAFKYKLRLIKNLLSRKYCEKSDFSVERVFEAVYGLRRLQYIDFLAWNQSKTLSESTKINCNRFLIKTLVDISVLHIKIRSLVE